MLLSTAKIIRVHRVTLVKRQRPYQKIKSTKSETSKVNNIVAESRYVFALNGSSRGGTANISQEMQLRSASARSKVFDPFDPYPSDDE